MTFDSKKALAEAEKRLNDSLPEIQKRHEKGVRESSEEPDTLKSGTPLNELEIKRILKEQDNEQE
jgi:hypothetical protein